MALKELIAIDIGSRNIKALHFKAVKKEKTLIPTLVNCKMVDSNAGGGLRFALADLVKALGVRKKFTIVNISGRQVLVKHLDLVQAAQNIAAVKAELGKVSPIDIADLYFDLYGVTARKLEPPGALTAEKTEERPAETQQNQQEQPPAEGDAAKKAQQPQQPQAPQKGHPHVVVAAKSTSVEELYEMIKETGLTPFAIEVDAVAIMNAFEFEQTVLGNLYQQKDKVTLFVDVGATHTLVHISTSMQSKFIREVYKGGNDFTDAIAKKLGIKDNEAEQIKVNPGDRADEVSGILGLAIEDLAHEIQMSVEFFESENDKNVDQVLLTGGASLTPGLVDSVAGATRKQVGVWAPVKSIPKQMKPEDETVMNNTAPFYSIATGLASRMMDSND